MQGKQRYRISAQPRDVDGWKEKEVEYILANYVEIDMVPDPLGDWVLAEDVVIPEHLEIKHMPFDDWEPAIRHADGDKIVTKYGNIYLLSEVSEWRPYPA